MELFNKYVYTKIPPLVYCAPPTCEFHPDFITPPPLFIQEYCHSHCPKSAISNLRTKKIGEAQPIMHLCDLKKISCVVQLFGILGEIRIKMEKVKCFGLKI